MQVIRYEVEYTLFFVFIFFSSVFLCTSCMNELNNNNDDDKTVSVLRSRRAWCQRQLEGRRKSYLLR